MDVLEMGDATRLLVQMHGSYVQLTHLPYKEGAATSAQSSEGSQAWVGQSLRTSLRQLTVRSTAQDFGAVATLRAVVLSFAWTVVSAPWREPELRMKLDPRPPP